MPVVPLAKRVEDGAHCSDRRPAVGGCDYRMDTGLPVRTTACFVRTGHCCVARSPRLRLGQRRGRWRRRALARALGVE